MNYKNPVEEYGASLNAGGVYEFSPNEYQVTSLDGTTSLMVMGNENRYNVWIPSIQHIKNMQNIVGAKYILDTNVNSMYKEPIGGGIELVDPIYQ